MTRRRKIIAVIVLLGIFIVAPFTALCPYTSIYVRLILGKARALSDQVPIRLTIDGKLITDLKCFHETSHFDGTSADILIIRLRRHDHVGEFGTIRIDREKKSASVPNDGPTNYQVVCGRWLLQHDGADWGVALEDGKMETDCKPDYQWNVSSISFTYPPDRWLPAGRWSIEVLDDYKKN
jgi:hypothetical protein